MTQISDKRRTRQRGQEILEFGLVGVLLVPVLLGMFVTGMGLIRSIEVNQVARDVTNIYIHGGDFSTYSMQQLAQRLAVGLNFQIGSSFTGYSATNSSNGGDGIIRVSQIMWVGSTTSANCVAVGAANCLNHDSFVFTQRIVFGNGSLSDPNTLGDPPAAIVNSAGVVTDPVTDTRAKLSGAAQTAMQNLWQVSGGNRTPLVDGQVVYIAEFYVRSPNLALGNLGGGAQYARYFF